jgi:UDP-2,3-diacylglucosamine pyrophosphatase LpxH
MITDVAAERMVVISDLHLGNPFSRAKGPSVEFLGWALRNRYDVCINGDGFEIAQASFTRIARDVPEVFQALKSLTASGRNVYYVVGNHDIALEHFLNDWGGFKVAPFLNVVSGPLRARVEHGHLYDPFFVRNPELYEFMTWLGGFALKASPGLYKLWISFERFKSRFIWKKSDQGIVGEHSNFIHAARELSERGFDAVVFGHTHHAGRIDLDEGRVYLNAGSWLMDTTYVEIENGTIALKRWQRGADAQDAIGDQGDRQSENQQAR